MVLGVGRVIEGLDDDRETGKETYLGILYCRRTCVREEDIGMG